MTALKKIIALLNARLKPGDSLVFVHGNFNILHPGHVRLLQFAKSNGTFLLVGVTPDGTAVAYPIRENGVDNVWVQPLNGSNGKRITAFDSEQILNFRWSPDGRKLCVLRGHTDSDVVLIRDSSS